MDRRQFIAAAAAAPRAAAIVQAAGHPKLCIFSKHMAQFDWKELGRKAKDLGFDGVDLTVRPKGHVLPERVKEDLPRAVDAIRAAGLDVPMITTDLKSIANPAAAPTLETAGKLGIKLIKPGYWMYTKDRTVLQTNIEARQNFRGLLKLAMQNGVTLGLHNHSGAYVGAALCAYRELLQDVDPKWAGYYFDPGHATVEGGLHVWRISLELVAPRLKMVAMKDAYWDKSNGRWRPKWVPLGEGMVDWPEVYRAFAKVNFTGPITLHVEYHAKDELEAIARDLAFMKKQVAAAYGA
jgi:L-ribulose-5-phosphate 3-epimerase